MRPNTTNPGHQLWGLQRKNLGSTCPTNIIKRSYYCGLAFYLTVIILTMQWGHSVCTYMRLWCIWHSKSYVIIGFSQCSLALILCKYTTQYQSSMSSKCSFMNRESSRESVRKSSRKSSRESGRKSSRESSRKSSRKSSRESRRESTRKSNRESNRESSRESSRKSSRESNRESSC